MQTGECPNLEITHPYLLNVHKVKNQSCYFVEHKTRKKKTSKSWLHDFVEQEIDTLPFLPRTCHFFFFSFCIRSARQLLFTLFSFQNSMILSTRTVTQNNDIRKRNTLINWAWLNFFLWNSTRFCFFLHFFSLPIPFRHSILYIIFSSLLSPFCTRRSINFLHFATLFSCLLSSLFVLFSLNHP